MNISAQLGASVLRTMTIDLTVDPGAFHTILPEAVAFEIGLRTFTNGPMRFDGPDVTMTVAYIRLLDREGAIPVVIQAKGPAVLGWSALQCLGLKLNDEKQVLEHERPYGPAMLGVRNG